MPLEPDPRTPADLVRQRNARRSARRAVKLAEEELRIATVAAYRQELGATIRSASPVLVALLEHAGSSLDAVAWQLRPPEHWPRRPRISGSSKRPAMDHAVRHHMAAEAAELEGAPFWPPAPDEVRVGLPGGGHVRAVVSSHVLEARGRLGKLPFSTCEGLLRLGLEGRLPESVVQALDGLPFGDLVRIPAFDGCGWVATRLDSHDASAIDVRTGMRPYRMPWIR